MAQGLLLTAALVPFEFSGSAFRLPNLSPLDYVCASLLVATLWRLGLTKFLKSVQSVFGLLDIGLWGLFYLYVGTAAIALDGNIRGALRWSEFLFIYWFAAKAFQDEDRPAVRGLSSVLAIAGAIVSGLALVQFLKAGGDYGFATGTFGQHNGLGGFLSLCLPATCALAYSSGGWFRRRWWIPGLISVAFLISYSRGAWLGMAGALAVHFFKRWSRFRLSLSGLRMGGWVLLLVVPLALFSNRRSLLDSGRRPVYWTAAWNILKNHPWVGLGPGNYQTHLQPYLPPEGRELYNNDLHFNHAVLFWQHLHNLYLQIMVEYGLIGAFLLFTALGLLVYRALYRTLRDPPLAAFQVSIMAFLVHNLVDIMTVNSFDLVIAMMLAACAFSPP